MRFTDYIWRRVDGKLRVGRTRMIVFAAIQAAAIAMLLGGSALFADAYPYVAPFGIAILAITWGGTISNFRTDRDLAARPPSNFHYVDLCEGCDPVRMRDMTPVNDVVKWYAHREKTSREIAKEILDGMSDEDLAAVHDAHDAYLAKLG